MIVRLYLELNFFKGVVLWDVVCFVIIRVRKFCEIGFKSKLWRFFVYSIF